VIRAAGGFFAVRDAEGAVYLCRARGKLKLESGSILVGDRVIFRPEEGAEEPGGAGEGTGIIETLLPRRSLLRRPPVANVEQIVLVLALKKPAPDWQLAGRILLQGEREKLPLLCCLNKIDLADAAERKETAAALDPLPYRLLWSSAREGAGIEQLGEALCGRCTVFAGPSGVGKSSLLNAVHPGLGLKTGTVSRKIGRGRHITRQVELLALPAGGFVVDTPGFSRLSFAGLEPDRLGDLFPEFTPHRESCSFRNCNHIHEPGCAVREAVFAGLINRCRYRQYQHFWKELNDKER
jgi:ribosome biogenesis GTPase